MTSGTSKIFIAWRALGTRTKELARILGIKVVFYKDFPPYISAAIRTVLALLRLRPKIVFIQLPQGPLLLLVAFLKKFLRFILIADVHTAFLYHIKLKEKLLNKPFMNYLKNCDIIILHNEEIRRKFIMEKELQKKAMVIHDPLPKICKDVQKRYSQKGVIKFIYPSSFAPDEPIEHVIQAFLEIIKENPNCILYITGNWKRQRQLKKYISISKNIVFTGFLPRKNYESLLINSDVVIALTRREYTFLSAAAEGLAAEKPLLLSSTRTLRSIFKKGAIFVSPIDANDIKRGLKLMLRDDIRKVLLNEIREFKREYISMLKKELNILQKLIAYT